MKFQGALSAALAEIQQIKKEIQAAILQLPDNPDLQRINSKCYVMKVSKLSETRILDPLYYDFGYQYRAISYCLDRWVASPETVIEKLQMALRKGRLKFTYPTGEQVNLKLNPAVIKNITNIIGA